MAGQLVDRVLCMFSDTPYPLIREKPMEFSECPLGVHLAGFISLLAIFLWVIMMSHIMNQRKK